MNSPRWERLDIILPIRRDDSYIKRKKTRMCMVNTGIYALGSTSRDQHREDYISTEDQHTVVGCVTIIDGSITQSLCWLEGSVISRIPRNSIGFAHRICRRNVENPSRELAGEKGRRRARVDLIRMNIFFSLQWHQSTVIFEVCDCGNRVRRYAVYSRGITERNWTSRLASSA